jgi:hypothetical protein
LTGFEFGARAISDSEPEEQLSAIIADIAKTIRFNFFMVILYFVLGLLITDCE